MRCALCAQKYHTGKCRLYQYYPSSNEEACQHFCLSKIAQEAVSTFVSMVKKEIDMLPMADKNMYERAIDDMQNIMAEKCKKWNVQIW